jgi:hypothetical protein
VGRAFGRFVFPPQINQEIVMAKKIQKVIKHLKSDISTFKNEANDDKKLIKVLKTPVSKTPSKKPSKKKK